MSSTSELGCCEDEIIVETSHNNESFNDLEHDEMQKKVNEMEDELEQLGKLQQQVEHQISSAADQVDENSIYVGQVEYEATPEDLRSHFASCGVINRITIMCDKITGQSKGFAYIEFSSKESVEAALHLDNNIRLPIKKISPKRQNIPILRGTSRGRYSSTRGQGFRGAPLGRGQFQTRRPPTGGRFRGRGSGRGAPGYFNSYY